MKLTATAIANPAGVGVVVAIVVLFGGFSQFGLPIQLFPEIEQPRMSVFTQWRAASPKEIEAEILEPQERVLQGLPGLETIEANANSGRAWIGLSFSLGTDMQQTTGIGIGTMVEVIGDIAPGDQLIVRGGERLRPGQPVTVVGSESDAS